MTGRKTVGTAPAVLAALGVGAAAADEDAGVEYRMNEPGVADSEEQ